MTILLDAAAVPCEMAEDTTDLVGDGSRLEGSLP